MTTSRGREPRGPRCRSAPRAGSQSPPAPLTRGDRSRIALAIQSLAVPIDSVTPHPNNPRVGDVAAVAASLERFGQIKPIVAQESTGYVVAGNHVLRAARSLGWTELAVAIEDLDDATATAYLLADNRTADLGGYDERLLAAILSDTAAAGNLAGTGYDLDAVAARIAAAGLGDDRDTDDCPAPPATADVYVRTGEMWELGAHRLLIGDSTDAGAVARVTDRTTVDLVWTDPPYGVGYVGKTAARLRLMNDDLGEVATRGLVAKALSLAPLRPGGVFYLAAPAGPLHIAFLLALRDAGLTVHQTLVWVKDRFVLGRADYHARYEPILYGWRDGAAHHFVPDRTQDTVWEIDRPSRSAEHPTMKPVALVERALRNSSRPGDTVYDPFAGSGTTLIAAEIAGRSARVIEIDPCYGQVIIERWTKFTGGQATRLSDDDHG